MKILIWSDAGAHTGYGTVTDQLTRRWVEQGAEIHVLATNYLGDPWPGAVKLYPASKNNRADAFGVGRVEELLNLVKPDVFFVLQDLYTVAEGLATLNGKFPVPTVLYVPVDGIPLPRKWLEAASVADVVVAMSYHGKRALNDYGIKSQVLWHGVDHNILYPVTKARPLYLQEGENRRALVNKEDCKVALGTSGRFVVLAVNRNAVRKNYPDTIRAFDRFRRRHPDAFLYIHAVTQDEGGDLEVLLDRFGLTREHAWIHNPGSTFVGSDKGTLTWIYNAADVKLSLSMAEGFGLTDLEALACGTPVIAQDYSATSEVVGPGGVLVPVQRHFTTARMVDFALPDMDAVDEALESLYEGEMLRKQLSDKAVQHANKFQWDATAIRFWELFQEIGRGVSVVSPSGETMV